MNHCVTPLHICASLGKQALRQFVTYELSRGQKLDFVEKLCDLVDRHNILFVHPGGHCLPLSMAVAELYLLGPHTLIFLLDIGSSGRCATLN